MAPERRTSLVRRFTWLFLALWGAALVLSGVIAVLTLPATPMVTVAANHLEARSQRMASRYLEQVVAIMRDVPAEAEPSSDDVAALARSHPVLASVTWAPRRGTPIRLGASGGVPAVMIGRGAGGTWWGTFEPRALMEALTEGFRPREGGSDFLLDERGRVLAASPGGSAPLSDRLAPPGKVVVVDAVPGQPGFFHRGVALRRPLAGTGLVLVNEEPVTVDLLRPDDRPMLAWLRPTLFALLSTGFLVLGALLAGRVVTTPLRHVAEGAVRIAEGDLAHRIEVTTHDEVADLARGFNQMAARLEQRERELTDKNVELEKANRLKTLFLANVSHELRTPLTSLIGFSEMLQDGVHGGLNDPQRAVVEKIRRNASALLALIDDLLDVTRIEAGKMELTLERVSLSECIESAWSAVEPQLEGRGLAFVPEMPEETLHVRGDFNRLRQVFVNLLANAVKFTEQGAVGVRLRRQGDRAQVEVWDEGIGIAPDCLAHVFDEFRQADSGVHRRYGGSGLGLAICRRLVRLHEGDLTVESHPERGSRFTVSLGLEVTPRSDTPPPTPH